MMYRYWTAAVVGLFLVDHAPAQDVVADTGVHLVSRQFSFTEGASVDKRGNVFFTDQPNNRIWEYDVHGRLSIFMDSAGRSNGMYFDRSGRLVTCADENEQLWAIGPDKKVHVLLRDVGGRRLNGPNDLWIDARGGIYFTDPYYHRPYWTRTKPEMDGERVYYLARGGPGTGMWLWGWGTGMWLGGRGTGMWLGGRRARRFGSWIRIWSSLTGSWERRMASICMWRISGRAKRINTGSTRTGHYRQAAFCCAGIRWDDAG